MDVWPSKGGAGSNPTSDINTFTNFNLGDYWVGWSLGKANIMFMVLNDENGKR